MSSQGFILSLTMKTLIKYNLPFLNLQDSKEIVLGRFKQAQCDWLAVVDQERFLGMVSLEVLSVLEFNSLEELSYTFIPDAVLSETHWYNYGLNLRKLQMTMAAVVTKEGAFMGYIFENDFKAATASLSLFEEEGVVIEVKMAQLDFSLTRLITIFEQTQQHILGLVTWEWDSEMNVLIKIAPNPIQETLAGLRRFGFEITFIEGEDLFASVLKENAAYLDTYLNI